MLKRLYFIILVFYLLCPNTSAQELKKEISFSPVPFLNPDKILSTFGPLVDYLAKETGMPLQLRLAPDMLDFENEISKGTYDIILSNPFQYIIGKERIGYKVFAKVNGELLKGLLLVRKDSGINDVSQLRGKSIALPSPTAWGASVLTRLVLEDKYKIDMYSDMKPMFFSIQTFGTGQEMVRQYIGSQELVILAVSRRITDAAGALFYAYRMMSEDIRNELKILAEAPSRPQMTLSAHPNLDEEIVKKIKVSLLEMDRKPEGKKILKELGYSSFQNANDKEYDEVRRVADRYATPGRPYASNFRYSEYAMPPPELAQGDPKEGRLVFERKRCIKCHAIKGKGGNIGPDLGTMEHKHTPYEMFGIMWNHSPTMLTAMKEEGIERPSFKGRELADLLTYLHSVAVLGDPKEGEKLFVRKYCVKCHSIKGRIKGGDIGPDLGEIKYRRSSTWIAQSLWNHSVKMEEKMREQGIPRPTFEGNEMAHIIAFLQSIQ